MIGDKFGITTLAPANTPKTLPHRQRAWKGAVVAGIREAGCISRRTESNRSVKDTTAGKFVGKRRGPMGHKGTYPYHLGTEMAHKQQVVHHVLQGLSRTTYHDARPHLIADTFQSIKALQTSLTDISSGCNKR